MSGSKISIVLATTALLVSVLFATPLGQAAGKLVLPKNSVGAVQLKKDAVNGLKVKNGSLTAADFKAGQLSAAGQGPKGDVGPKGPKGDPSAQGPKGDKGDIGAPGISGYQVVHYSSGVAVDPGAQAIEQVGCPNGKKALGGGLNSGQPVALSVSGPSPDGTWWYVTFKNISAAPTAVAAYAVCAHVG